MHLAPSVGLYGRVAVKKGNREKRLRYAKWLKNWTENQWQQVLWRDESSPEPRLNIIEAMWDRLHREQNKRQPTSKEQLWDVLQEAWRTIPEDYLKK